MIEQYSFGRIMLDGKTYNSDIIIYPDGRILDSWWRTQGHYLERTDIEDLIAATPECIVVGTGASGCMQVDPQLKTLLKELGIELYSAPTGSAIEMYNDMKKQFSTGACFHLTC